MIKKRFACFFLLFLAVGCIHTYAISLTDTIKLNTGVKNKSWPNVSFEYAFYWSCPVDTPCIVAKIGIILTVSKITIESMKKTKILSHPLDDACRWIEREGAMRGEGEGGEAKLHLL